MLLSSGQQGARCARRRFASFCRAYASSPPPKRSGSKPADPLALPKDKWNYNKSSLYDPEPIDHSSYKRVTANELEKYRVSPRRVKMLVRDFIEDSLYNPHYGYFATSVEILQSPHDFSKLKNQGEFDGEIAKAYDEHGPGEQLWHTPTELFKPYYGRAIAKCLVSDYKIKYFPYDDFLIYEIGAGNGTLALDILDYIQEEYPEVYERTRYNIIEISDRLVQTQRKKLSQAHPCVTVHHQSIFHWIQRELSPCYFLAMEVVDNFAHDEIRYDIRTLEPYEGNVVIHEDGDFDQYYTKVQDPLISSYLGLQNRLSHANNSWLLRVPLAVRNFYASLPFAPNLSPSEYIPTRLINLLRTLRTYFPRHRLLLSDFSTLPDTIPGINSPVVQTRHFGQTIPCQTLLVKQGTFDIFFPTNFERLRDMYEYLIDQPHQHSHSHSVDSTSTTARSSISPVFFSSVRSTYMDGATSASGVRQRRSSVYTHAEFMKEFAELDKTRLRNGQNPLLEYYLNTKVLF